MNALTIDDIVALTGHSKRHIRRNRKQLGAVKQGKRVVFPFHTLPDDLRAKAAERHGKHGPQLVKPEPAPPQMALQLTAGPAVDGSASGQSLAVERYSMIRPLIDQKGSVWVHCGRNSAKCVAFLSEQLRVSERTLWRWVGNYRKRGLGGLAEQTRADKGKHRALDAAGLSFLRAALITDGAERRSVAEMYRAYEEERDWRARHPQPDKPALPQASYDTLLRAWQQIPRMIRTMALEGVDAFANHEEILSWRDIESVKPMEWLVMDHRMLDVHCLVPATNNGRGWRLVRPWATAAIDMRTRKWLAWVIVETPSSDSIASALKAVCLRWGIPAHGYWDNGRDFRSVWLEGANAGWHERRGERFRIETMTPAMSGVADRLGIRITHAIPKRARSKIIEPNFLRLAHYDASLPWYCGNSPERPSIASDIGRGHGFLRRDRPAAFDELVAQHDRWLKGEPGAEQAFPTIEEIAALYDDAFTTLNEQPFTHGVGMRKAKHTGGQAWMSPDECWKRCAELAIARPLTIEQQREIRFAFLKRRRITVEHGEVGATFGGRRYHYRLVGQEIALMLLNGRECELAYDPLDLGTAALYHDDAFIGLVENAELRKMGESDFVRDERNRRAARSYVREFLRKLAETSEQYPSTPHRARRRAEVRGWPQLPPAEPVEPQIPQIDPEPEMKVESARVDDADDGVHFDFYGEGKGE